MQQLQTLLNIGHHLDRRWRRYRCVILLQRYREYREWLGQQLRTIPDNRHLVVFDFATNQVDGPQGRRFYGLFIFFVRAGYYPILKENYLFLANIQERYKADCLAESFSVITDFSSLDREFTLVTDRHDASSIPDKVVRVIQVEYQVGFHPDDDAFPMPFPMFPAIYKFGQDLHLERYRQQIRQWKIFFGGDADFVKYNKSTIRDIYQKLPRAQVLALLRMHLKPDEWFEPLEQQDLDVLLKKAFAGLVIANTRDCKVPVEDWLGTVAKAQFFLACPGVRYPMSHNLIEAMAVGSVPITQYPELFFPPLIHGENCLVYRDEEDLIAVVKQAIYMQDAEVRTLSEGAVRYYEAWLKPESVMTRLLSVPRKKIALRLLSFLKVDDGFA